MKIKGIYHTQTCFGGPHIDLSNNSRLFLDFNTRGLENFKDDEKVTVELKNDNGSAVWNLEKQNDTES